MRSWQSLAIPLVMLFTGLILVGGDRVGILSLDRIQNFWPLALIVVGVMELPAQRRQRS